MDDEGFRVSVDEHPTHYVVRVEGEVDLVTAPKLDTCLAACSDRDLVLDLSQVPFIDSTGLKSLVLALRRMEDGKSVLVGEASAEVTRLLELTGLARRLRGDGLGGPAAPGRSS